MLWDVDGTLLDSGGATTEAFDAAVTAAIGRHPGDHGVAMSGKTDPSIAMEILAFAGLDQEEARRLLPMVLGRLEAEIAAASSYFTTKGRVLPGVERLLARLHRHPGVAQSVLTGNTEANARTKLVAFGLDGWLDLGIGAFGSDRPDRDELVPVALERCRNQRGIGVEPRDVWIVGDTPRDLACARAAGARCMLVATGRFHMAALREAGADHVAEDLSSTDEVSSVLLA